MSFLEEPDLKIWGSIRLSGNLIPVSTTGRPIFRFLFRVSAVTVRAQAFAECTRQLRLQSS
jgi:hypothetical protein